MGVVLAHPASRRTAATNANGEFNRRRPRLILDMCDAPVRGDLRFAHASPIPRHDARAKPNCTAQGGHLLGLRVSGARSRRPRISTKAPAQLHTVSKHERVGTGIVPPTNSSEETTMPRMLPDPTFYPSPKLAGDAPAESLAYVALLTPGDNGKKDALGVVDTDPESPDYGTLVGKLELPQGGNELH